MFMSTNRKFKYFILRHLIKPFILISALNKLYHTQLYVQYSSLPLHELTGFKHVEGNEEFNILV